ncbi:hypothetical protein EsH8_II_001501 [Colletotrichum jinshuiense]
MHPAYRHLAPNQIRLVALNPGTASDPLTCTLHETALDSAPAFEAVSYVCGPLDLTDTLVVLPGPVAALDGVPSSGITHAVSIMPHVSSLLHSLRSATESRTLWVDALCINQADVAEKSAQVQQMRQIYARARRVVIWLGPADEDGSSDRALAFMEKMAMHKKFADRGHYLGGQRVGSDTSSECGVGRCGDASEDEMEEEDDDDDSTGDEGYGSGLPSDDGASSTASSEMRAYLERVEQPEPLRSNSELLWEWLCGFIDGVQQKLQRQYTYYFVYGYWNPLWRRRVDRAWSRAVAAWALNAKRVSHIAFGKPVLYENDMHHFFQERYRDGWADVDRLLARPWWVRAWAVHEAWSAGDTAVLQCGRRTIKWKTLQKALPYEEAWDDMGNVMVETQDPRIEQWSQLRERYAVAFHLCKKRLLGGRLSDLLWNTWEREADDPRDKVFAMLGLVGKGDGLLLPDYSKPPVQVFCEVARNIIRTEDSLDILLAAGTPGEAFKEGILPSWVPDWRNNFWRHNPRAAPLVDRSRIHSLHVTGSVLSIIVNGHGFTACADEKAVAWFTNDLERLHVRAVLIDEIGSVGRPQTRLPIDTKEVADAACSIVNAAFVDGVPHWWDNNEKGGVPGLVRKVLMAGSRGERTEEEAVQNTMLARRAFVTRHDKYVCIGARETRLGDLVFIVAGCNVPLVFREKADGPVYELIGEAYVHGIMHGEAISQMKSTSWWEKLAWWRPPKEVKWRDIEVQ